jgi:hypothetical protein
LIFRLLARTSAQSREISGATIAPGDWADNGESRVSSLVKTVLREPSCLIVTGCQDFLSTLTVLLEAVDDLQQRPPNSIRIVFGTNTESGRSFRGTGRAVAEEARAHFLGSRGVSVEDLADLRAVMATEAI